MQIKKRDINKTLIAFLFAHFFVWTLIPSISNTNLPLDTIEALAWGSNLEWGFNKHPPLSALFPTIFFKIFESQDWAYYLLSQLFVVFTFFIIFKFSEDFFKDKTYSLISILLLEGIYFYNFTTPEFNVNVCQLPFWALTVYFCWKSIKQDDIKSWILFGLFAALGVLSKYLFFYLIIAIKIFFIRVLLKKKKINLKYFIPGIVCILVLAPHVIWLTENNYITLNYALERTELGESNYWNHLLYPLIYLGKQIGVIIPFIIMFLFTISKFKTKFKLRDERLIFLLAINLIPIILMFLTSLIMGVKIRTMWMTPFYLFSGVLFIYVFQNKIVLHKLKYFFSVFLIMFISFPVGYLYISVSQTDKRTDYPGKEIAKSVETEWNKIIKKNEKKIKRKSIDFVGWDEWYAGNLSYNLKGTTVLMENWIDKLLETEDKNYVLIEKKDSPKKTCALVKQKPHLFLTNYLMIKGHHVCFISNLKWMSK